MRGWFSSGPPFGFVREKPLHDQLTRIRREFSSNSAFILQTPRIKGAHRAALLSRIQLDDQLFVHDGLHLFARRDVGDFAAEPVAIGCEPVGHWSNLRQIEVAQYELT